MKARDLKELELALGYGFRRRELLEHALTHSSLARELALQLAPEADGALPRYDNEQLEFLGDAVLGFVTSQALFERYPEFHEGQLSKLRAHLVSETHLIRAAKKLKLGRFLRLGRGEEKSGGRKKVALQVDSLEAVLAAMWLDAGLEKTRELILDLIIDPELKRQKRRLTQGLPITDFKSALQEALHSSGRSQPHYALVREEGPEHQKRFTIEARVLAPGERGSPEYVGLGEGSSKKKAEQEAAKQALEYLWSLEKKGPKKPSRTKGATRPRGSQ
jgi:ribonuclease-3